MPPPLLTLEQLALQKARKEAKAKKKAAAAAASAAGLNADDEDGAGSSTSDLDRRKFLSREWIDVEQSTQAEGSTDGRKTQQFSLITWNLLAQSLIRRELFPGSDCLRWGDRKHMLLAELESYRNVDVICFQECDRLEDLSVALPDHTAISAKGRGKQHGCVILYQTSRWEEKACKVVYLDEEELCPEDPSTSTQSSSATSEDLAALKKRRGGSRRTKNIALIAALSPREGGGEGVIVATTHLFWHPKYLYERVRQIIIIIRSIRAFQKEYQCEAWRVILAGDLNTSPSEAPYQLLANPQISLHQIILDELEESRHVHSSIEQLYIPPTLATNGETGTGTNSATASGVATPAEPDNDREDEPPTGGQTKDESVPNPRPPNPEDGFVEVSKLVNMMKELVGEGATSAYGSSAWAGGRETYGSRGGFEDRGEKGIAGWEEPNYTSFTPVWHLTLDYIFILPSAASPPPSVTALIRPATKEELGDGLPRKGICASDHLAVGCRLEW